MRGVAERGERVEKARGEPTESAVPQTRVPLRLAQVFERVAELLERLFAVGGEVEETVGRVGGGALPLTELPSFACAVEESLAEPLRACEPPVIGIVRDGRLLLDCRTLADDDVDEVAAAVRACR